MRAVLTIVPHVRRKFVGRQPHYRTKHCRRCRRQYNRDVVGHRNILTIYLWQHEFNIQGLAEFNTVLELFNELANLNAFGPRALH